MVRHAISVLSITLPILVQPVFAQAPTVPPGGAPPPKSGGIQVRGYIRVIDGDTVETYVKGNQVGIGLLGIDAPEVNTPCGRIAADALQALLGYSGPLLDEDIDNAFDKRKRRLYRIVLQTRDLSLEMVRQDSRAPQVRVKTDWNYNGRKPKLARRAVDVYGVTHRSCFPRRIFNERKPQIVNL